ncbi:peptidoglycan DD-metalloendopeptidase family protein [Vibrio sp. Of7-15]|uniref:M23 family metallopeptidase n=1 Tax=Vibrio sp. Of7-15 TaxID=2724879 RepID=UPI001EF1B1CF|nr:M23 family metallopeptidase [Vibrio sp. Of7-15]MCG7499848.1 peptidoglycan DD-metalloendopeptidase family protein [Vibrio sp. Of7-15]
MPNNIRISVSHNRGTLFLSVSKTKKHIILSSIAALFCFILAITSGLYYLNKHNNDVSQALSDLSIKKQQQQQEFIENQKQLALQIEAHETNNHELTQQLEKKNNLLSVLGQRVDDVESVLGLHTPQSDQGEVSDISLEQRLDTAAINSAVRATMFRLIPNATPLNYTRASSPFGRRINPVSKKRHHHLGIDLTCKRGTEMFAPADGVVELVRPSKKGYGNLLKLRHSFGFMTMYAHLDKFKVKTGQFIQKGDLIATCGNSGNSTGPHLHYEVRFLGRAVDPKPFMDWTPDKFESLFEKEHSIKWASLVDVINNVVKVQMQLTHSPTVEATPLKTAHSSSVESSENIN